MRQVVIPLGMDENLKANSKLKVASGRAELEGYTYDGKTVRRSFIVDAELQIDTTVGLGYTVRFFNGRAIL